MKALKYVLYAVGGLVLLGVIACVALILVVDGAFVKDRLARQMKEDYQRTLVIEGTPTLSLFPVVALDLGKTRLSERASDKEFVSLESMKVAVRVMPLLSRTLEVDSLALTGLKVNVIRAKDGSRNFDDLTGKKSAAGPDAATREAEHADRKPMKIGVAGLLIERAQLSYQDEKTGQQVSVAQINLKTGRLADDTPAPVAFGAQIKGSQPNIDLKLGLSGSLRMNLTRQAFEVAGLSFDVKGVFDRDTIAANISAPQVSVTPAKASGSAVTGTLAIKGPQRSADARLRMSALEGSASAFSIPGVVLDFEANTAGNAVKGQISTPVKASLAEQTWELPQLVANLTFSGPAIPQKSVTLPLRAALKADLRKQTFSADVSTKFDDSSIQAKVAAAKLAPLHATFDINVGRLNLDRYLAEKPAAETKPDQPIDLSGLKGPTLEGKVQIGSLQIKQAKLENIKVDIKLSGGKLTLPQYSAGLYGGTLAGGLSVDAGSNRFQVKNTLTGVSIGPLLRDVAKKDMLEGRGNLSLDVDTSGASVPALKKALAGSAKVELKEGAIKGINLAESVRNFKATLGSKSAQTAGDSAKKTDFSEMSASFVIKNGVAKNDDLKAASPFLRLGGAGSVDIGNSTLEYLAKATLAATAKGQGGAAEVAGITVPVKLTGPLDNPAWSVDYSGMLGNLGAGTAGKLTETLKSVTGGAAGGVKDKLKGLFGK